MATLNLAMPASGIENVFVLDENIDVLDLQFPINDALFERIDNNLVILFDNESVIVLENFYGIYSENFMPEFVLEDTRIAGEEFFAAFETNLLPAAAGIAGSSGFVGSASQQSNLEALSNTNASSNQEAPTRIGSNQNSASNYETSGLGRGLTFLSNSSNVNQDSSNSFTDITLPRTSYYYKVDEQDTDYQNLLASDKFDASNLVVLDAKYQNDITIDSQTGTATLSGDLHTYADSLTPGQVVHALISTPIGDFMLELTGNSLNDDNLSFNSFRGTNTQIQNESGLTGQETPYVFKGNLNLGEGDDKVQGTSASGGEILAGIGNDTVTITNISNDLIINGENGNDSISTEYMRHNAQILGGDGEDSIQLEGRLLSGIIDGGNDNDSITIYEATGVNNDLRDNVKGTDEAHAIIRGGSGDDNITILNSLSQNLDDNGNPVGSIELSGGTGNDTISIKAVYQSSINTNINGDSGEDSIQVGTFHAGYINAGSEDDTVALDYLFGGSITGGDGSDTFKYTSNGADHTQIVLNDDYTINVIQNGEQINALISDFENASGGDGDDIIIGNQHSNILTGGIGSDTITGGGGADTFVFTLDHFTNEASDVITDFGSDDILDLQAFADAGYIITKANVNGNVVYTVTNGLESQTITLQPSVEVVSTQYDQQIFDNEGLKTGNNLFKINEHAIHQTGDGNDLVQITVSGNNENYGMQAENHTPFTTNKNEIITGNGNDDVFITAEGENSYGMHADKFFGTSLTKNLINTGNGNDKVVITATNAIAGEGENLIQTGSGNDIVELNGKVKNATIQLGADNDSLFISELGRSVDIEADSGNDTITVEILKDGNILTTADTNSATYIYGGQGGNDLFILQSTNANTIQLDNDGTVLINSYKTNIVEFEGIGGGFGNDTIIGSDNADTLLGGKGSDMLTGGLGDDIFSFSPAEFEAGTTDIITDYTSGELLDLTAYKMAGFDFSISIDDGSTIFTLTNFEGSQEIILDGYVSSTLSVDDIQQQLDVLDSSNGGIRI